MECQAAGAVSEEEADPLDQVWAYPLPAEERKERWGLYVVEAPLHVKEESGDFVVEAVEGLDLCCRTRAASVVDLPGRDPH